MSLENIFEREQRVRVTVQNLLRNTGLSSSGHHACSMTTPVVMKSAKGYASLGHGAHKFLITIMNTTGRHWLSLKISP